MAVALLLMASSMLVVLATFNINYGFQVELTYPTGNSTLCGNPISCMRAILSSTSVRYTTTTAPDHDWPKACPENCMEINLTASFMAGSIVLCGLFKILLLTLTSLRYECRTEETVLTITFCFSYIVSCTVHMFRSQYSDVNMNLSIFISLNTLAMIISIIARHRADTRISIWLLLVGMVAASTIVLGGGVYKVDPRELYCDVDIGRQSCTGLWKCSDMLCALPNGTRLIANTKCHIPEDNLHVIRVIHLCFVAAATVVVVVVYYIKPFLAFAMNMYLAFVCFICIHSMVIADFKGPCSIHYVIGMTISFMAVIATAVYSMIVMSKSMREKNEWLEYE